MAFFVVAVVVVVLFMVRRGLGNVVLIITNSAEFLL